MESIGINTLKLIIEPKAKNKVKDLIQHYLNGITDMLLEYNSRLDLPTAEELPDSDDSPVDNELQDLVPHLLKAILALIWSERRDWFFGVDMGIYYDPDKLTTAIVPDAFLSIGVPRVTRENLRLSYVLWDELVIPTLMLEVVSQTRRGEYTEKKEFYQEMGILYYVIYNPLRKIKPPLEVYELREREYYLKEGEPVWLEAIGLGIGREVGIYEGVEREWLYWYNQEGERYLTPEERVVIAQKQATQAQKQATQAQKQATQAQKQARESQIRTRQLEEILRNLGIDPNSI